MALLRRNRVYADTSVFGGIADTEFAIITNRFFDEVRRGKHILIVSEVTVRELQGAPEDIRRFLIEFPAEAIETLPFTPEMDELQNAYLDAKIVGRRSIDDAAHVAAATVARADIIVSWNFRHIVKWDRIRGFNAVNLLLGYPIMTILSPREVIADEEEV